MARPSKTTVDYFPHFVKGGRTLFILESTYGNDGYAFWFKVLEILCSTDGQAYDCSNAVNWKYLLAKTAVSEEKARDIMEMLCDLNAIDADLWRNNKIIWSDGLANNLSRVYDKRSTERPEKPVMETETAEEIEFSARKPQETDETDTKTPQSKVKKSKVKKSIDEELNSSMSANADANAESHNEEIDFEKLVEFFNATVKETIIPTIRQLSGNRKNFVNARLREFGETAIHTVIKKAAASHFLNGGGSQGFVASFDWIFRPNNFPKILEGNYDNDKNRNYGSSRNSDDRTNNGSTGAEPDKPRKRGFTSAWENEQREKQAGGTAGS